MTTLTNNSDIFDEILEDSASNGGARNANNRSVTSEELAQVVDRVLIGNAKMEARYQDAIADASNFSAPQAPQKCKRLLTDRIRT